NFRSQPSVIEFVNALFCNEMGPQYEALDAHRQQLGPRPSVEFLWATEPESRVGFSPPPQTSGSSDEGGLKPTLPDDTSGSPSERNRRREAEWIARRIRGMLDSG